MSWTAAFSDFATTDWSVVANQTTTSVANTINTSSKSSSVDETSSTMIATVQRLSIFIGFVGTFINLFLFVTLTVFKEFRKNTTNVFICNQMATDAALSLALTVTMITRQIRAFDYAVGFGKRILCWFLDNTSLIGATMEASTVSLIVIALECYFKIVHPVKHRNNFRSWMVKLGVIAPWINGLLVVILPAWLTSDVVDGVCNIAMKKSNAGQLYFIFKFIWHDILPVLTFIFCYSKILIVVRHQNRISTLTNRPNYVTAGQSSRSAANNFRATIELSMREATGGSRTNEDISHRQISNAEKKVIVTMLTVTACYITCWFPLDLFLIFVRLLPLTVVSIGDPVLTIIAYMNVLLNAVIYSFRFGVITRVWRAFRRQDAVQAAVTITHTSLV
jgi:hypothetical protein